VGKGKGGRWEAVSKKKRPHPGGRVRDSRTQKKRNRASLMGESLEERKEENYHLAARIARPGEQEQKQISSSLFFKRRKGGHRLILKRRGKEWEQVKVTMNSRPQRNKGRRPWCTCDKRTVVSYALEGLGKTADEKETRGEGRQKHTGKH